MRPMDMIAELANKLNMYRQNPADWLGLAWVMANANEEYMDVNEGKRTEMLVALQFDWREEDQAFIQYLLQEEILNRSHDPFQGCTNNLYRAGYLLAKYRNPENLHLLLGAKTANFDTHCGFDWEYILSAGVGKSFAQAESLDEKSKEAFNFYFGSQESCPLSEEDIEQWLARGVLNYPPSAAEDDQEFWIDMALEIGNKIVAREWVDQFALSQDRNKEFLLTLKYYMQQLNDPEAHISLAEQLLMFPQEFHVQIDRYLEISQLYLTIHEPNKAWKSLQRAIVQKNRLNEYQLGRMAHICIEIVNADSLDMASVQACYQFGIGHLGEFQSLNQAQNNLSAAKKVNDLRSAARFEVIVKEKQREMDELMNEIEQRKKK